MHSTAGPYSSDLSSSYLNIAGIRTFMISGGRGEPLIFLHGLGASSYSWRHILPVLARDHAVFAPDLPGYGRTDKPEDFPYTLLGFSHWLAAFMAGTGIRRAALIGNSMGGAISLLLALSAPASVSHLALIGTPLYLESTPPMLWNLRRPVIGWLLERMLGRWAVKVVAPTAFHDRSLVTEDMIAEYSLALRSRAGRRAVSATLRRCISPELPGFIAGYAGLRLPILVIRGQYDGILDEASARRFCRTAPQASLLQLPDCGHVPQEERPQEVLAAVSRFLKINR